MSRQAQGGAYAREAAAEAVPFPDETAHLAKINRTLCSALANAETEVLQLDKDYMGMKRYMVRNRGEIDPHEMFQNELSLKRIDSEGAFAAAFRNKIASLMDSPYFARIDFRPQAEKAADAFYIGRFSFSHNKKLLIIDWRAPVASMFYDCETGPACYYRANGGN